MSNLNNVISFFLGRGKNIYSGSTFTIPGSGFDTTSCRNRNHNKLGRLFIFFLQGQGLMAGRLPLCSVNCLSALAGWVFPGVERKKWIFLQTVKIPVEQSVFCISDPPRTLKQVLKLFWSCFWSYDPLSPWLFCLNTCDTKTSSYTASLGFRWQHKTSLVKK